MANIVFPKWRDENAKGNYPFIDTASRQSIDGYVIPTELIIDAVVYVGDVTLPVWLSGIAVTSVSVAFALSDRNGLIGSGEWSERNLVQDTVAVRDDNGLVICSLVVDPAVVRPMIDRGRVSYSFAEASTRFVLSVVNIFDATEADRGIEGEVLPEQNDVYVVGVDGVQLECISSTETIDGVTYPITRVDVNAVGNPLASRELCSSVFKEPRFITSVVFQKGKQTFTCSPSNLGDVLIVAASIGNTESALRVGYSAGGITVGLFGKTK